MRVSKQRSMYRGPFTRSAEWIDVNAVSVTAPSELRKVLFLAPSVCGVLFAYKISREPLNGFAPNSHGRRVWSLARTSLKVKVKSQSYQEKWHFSALSAACVRFVW